MTNSSLLMQHPVPELQQQALQSDEEHGSREEEQQHPFPSHHISVYLIILLCTPSAGRLWREPLCYSMREEAGKVLISRLTPGAALFGHRLLSDFWPYLWSRCSRCSRGQLAF